MKKKWIAALLLCLLLSALTTPALADSGPKPTTTVYFSNISGEYYGALLSSQEFDGPWNVDAPWQSWMDEDGVSKEVYETMRQHPVEGWYFVGLVENCTGSHQLSCTYFPPDPFRVMVYQPETETFTLSEPLDRYAFDSYFPRSWRTGRFMSRPGGTHIWQRFCCGWR